MGAHLHQPLAALPHPRVDQRLWRHVVGCADLLISPDVGRVVGDGLGDAKVDELEATFDEDKVGRLEIRVNDVLIVNDLDRLEHLVEKEREVRKVLERGRRASASAYLFPDVANEVHADGLARVLNEEVVEIRLADFHNLNTRRDSSVTARTRTRKPQAAHHKQRLL